jgi:hypothetical protein
VVEGAKVGKGLWRRSSRNSEILRSANRRQDIAPLPLDRKGGVGWGAHLPGGQGMPLDAHQGIARGIREGEARGGKDGLAVRAPPNAPQRPTSPPTSRPVSPSCSPPAGRTTLSRPTPHLSNGNGVPDDRRLHLHLEPARRSRVRVDKLRLAKCLEGERGRLVEGLGSDFNAVALARQAPQGCGRRRFYSDRLSVGRVSWASPAAGIAGHCNGVEGRTAQTHPR